MKIFGIIGKLLFISVALCNLVFLRVYSGTNNQNKKIININENYLYFNPENNYKLGHGDRISIQIDDIPELSSIHVIDEKGTIYLSDLDRIYVKNLTTRELKELLNIEYSKYVYDPKINVSILSYRPVRVYIKGEIQNPGYINLNANTQITSLPQINSS